MPTVSPQEAGRRALVEQTDHAQWVDQQRERGPAQGDSWEPVPVPRPTYTMKARAGTRPAPTQAPADVPQVLDAIEDDVVAPRRVVGG